MTAIIPIGGADAIELAQIEKFLGVIALTACLDWVWAKYNIATTERRHWLASTYSALIYLFGAVVVIEYVKTPTLIFACAIGAFIGTFVGTFKWK